MKKISNLLFEKNRLLLFLIVVLAAFFRLYGLNWDQDQHLHPDERFLTMVETAISIPKSFKDYLNPNVSTLNPYNFNFNFFVYGTFPINLTKIVGEIIHKNDYGNIHFVGRVLSAIFDIGTVLLLFIIGKKSFNEKIGLLSAFLYSLMVLPIQLSHFFAVDTFLNFFITLSFLLIINIVHAKHLKQNTFFLGVSFGLALACKVSSLYFSPIIGLVFLYQFFREFLQKQKMQILLPKYMGLGFIFLISTLIIFRLGQPTAFTDGNLLNWSINPQFVSNLKELKTMSDPDSWFPPVVQWKKTIPIIFPLKNLILWGIGIPLGTICIISLLYSLVSLKQSLLNNKTLIFKLEKSIILGLIVLWIVGLFTYQGIQFCKTIRYFLLIYPFLAIITANFLVEISQKINRRFSYLKKITLLSFLIYPISFMSIYSQPITRVSASAWMYDNVPINSVLANEHWDDPLPLSLPNGKNFSLFKGEILELYAQDTAEKWEKINKQLSKTDYIILSSNRLYGSIPNNPEFYPQTTMYYDSLFKEKLGFTKVVEFTSRPCFPPFKPHLFCFNDDSAEESFTVYDHPKVTIFKKADKRI